MKKNYKKIGILGGSFDPAHKGHLKISIEAKKKVKISKIIWAITKKNPFKSKNHFSLMKRITLSKKMGEVSVKEKNQINQKQIFEEVKKSNIYKQVLEILPDAELVDVKKIEKENND